MRNEKAYEHSHHRFSRCVRRFLRNGFNGFLRSLPGEPGLLPPSLTRSSPRELDISVGISGPHDFAVRVIARSSVARQASTASLSPTFCDDRETPLFIGPGRAGF